MTSDLELFKHIYIDNKAKKTLFLFHGTGGDENDLLFIGQELEGKYNLVGLRGNVQEQGMNRFFRRHAMGVFDQENLQEEVEKLRKFLTAWDYIHNTSSDTYACLGYSNGANMILAALFIHPEIIKTAVLLHGMLPFKPKESLDISSNNIFLSYGTYDQMILANESLNLIHTLTSMRAKLAVHEYPAGHELTQEEIRDVVSFLS